MFKSVTRDPNYFYKLIEYSQVNCVTVYLYEFAYEYFCVGVNKYILYVV